MKNFNLNRLNAKKIELGEKPLILKRTDYQGPIYRDGSLIDEYGRKIGTKGDMYAKVIMDDIMEKGTLDQDPRPHYEDGEPAPESAHVPERHLLHSLREPRVHVERAESRRLDSEHPLRNDAAE